MHAVGNGMYRVKGLGSERRMRRTWSTNNNAEKAKIGQFKSSPKLNIAIVKSLIV